MGGIFVAIVNYRTGDLVLDCLSSLVGQVADLRGGRVIIVDNHSGDASPQVLRRQIELRGWADWAECLDLPRNGGFAYGNNAAIARVRDLDPAFDAVVMLNPDTLVQPGTIRHLAAFLDSKPEVGIAGARIENRNGDIEVSAHADPSPWDELKRGAELGWLSRWPAPATPLVSPTGAHVCDWVSGACMAVRRQVLDAVGPLDEGFFLYFEEVDFCVRARRRGWPCWFVPDARVVHFEGAATGIRVARRRLPQYWYASRRRFFVKCYGVSGLLAADLLWALGRFTLVLRRALGLGGRSGIASEPVCMAWDLLVGDFNALASGELRRIRHGVSGAGLSA